MDSLPFCFLPLPSAFCLLLSVFCLLPSAFCLLPSAFCFLLSAFRFLLSVHLECCNIRFNSPIRSRSLVTAWSLKACGGDSIDLIRAR